MEARRQGIGLVGWLLASFAAAAVGGIASANAQGFYQQLDKPAWAPPPGLFGPVWSVRRYELPNGPSTATLSPTRTFSWTNEETLPFSTLRIWNSSSRLPGTLAIE